MFSFIIAHLEKFLVEFKIWSFLVKFPEISATEISAGPQKCAQNFDFQGHVDKNQATYGQKRNWTKVVYNSGVSKNETKKFYMRISGTESLLKIGYFSKIDLFHVCACVCTYFFGMCLCPQLKVQSFLHTHLRGFIDILPTSFSVRPCLNSKNPLLKI